MRKTLHKFRHILQQNPEYSPHIHTVPNYGQKVQYAEPLDVSEYLSDNEINFVEQVCSTFLYYTIGIDNQILPSLSDISLEKSKATKNIAKQVTKLLNYMTTNPNAEIQCRASGMQLAIHSDASYLSVSKARSRASGVHFLSEGPFNPQDADNFVLTIIGILYVDCKIIKNIMASVAEAEFGTIFINAKKAMPIHTTLTEMGCPQVPAPIQVDNSTAVGIATNTITQKKSKTMDMQFYWINDRIG